jgi:2-amino-4-hydroxy-6-hydroxymethyldihydropteridine diphosphokinase
METELSPMDLLQQLLVIEMELGRVRHPEIQGYSSRTADLDLLYYGSRVIQTEKLTIPHPRLHLRRFALVPLCEVAPDFKHPVFKLTQKELLEQCTDDCLVREMLLEENRVK